jgi:hypothetical protein
VSCSEKNILRSDSAETGDADEDVRSWRSAHTINKSQLAFTIGALETLRRLRDDAITSRKRVSNNVE